MEKVCRLTGNTRLIKNGFSSVNAAIEWGKEVEDVITTAVTAAIRQKDNEHGLALLEMRTANKRELQKVLQKLATLSKRVDGLAIREDNKGDGGYNKSGGGGNNGRKGGDGGNHNTSRKNNNKEIMTAAATNSGYTQKAWNTIPHGPIRRGNGSTKSGTWLEKFKKGRSSTVE